MRNKKKIFNISADQNKLIKSIKKICKTISINDDVETVRSYSADWRGRFSNLALCVAFPKSSNEVSKLVKLCNKKNLPVIPQGGNTGLVCGTMPTKNKKEIIINLKLMNKTIQVDTSNKHVTADSGVIIEELSKTCAEKDLFFPLKMASTGSCQVGGVIATNAGGANVIKYGTIKDNLLSLEYVSSSGDVIQIGNNVIKDNTGYKLKDIFCGSEGTLGIITKATFRLYTQKCNYLDCFISFDTFGDLLKIHKIISDEFENFIESCEIIPQLAFDLCKKHKLLKQSFFSTKSKYYILLRLISNNNDHIIDKLSLKLSKHKGQYKEILISQNDKQSNSFWKFREDLTEAQKLEGKVIAFDISLPIDKIENFINDTKNKISKILPDIQFYYFGHLGDSNIHFNLIEPQDFRMDFFKYEDQFSKIVYNAVTKNRGSISAEHGIGNLKKKDFVKTISKSELILMREIRGIFDPKGIFNSGKLF